MARVTIEDCRKHIKNRFELVLLAAQRAKDLSLGLPALVQNTKDKNAVLALREIAAGVIDCDKLRQLVLSKYLDPMKQGFKGLSSTLELENLFKELAASVSHEENNKDGYEHDELEILENSLEDNLLSSDERFDYDEDEERDEDKLIKEPQFDLDINFDDIESED
jgi:DNA-directed RNA polymerase subunit omega